MLSSINDGRVIHERFHSSHSLGIRDSILIVALVLYATMSTPYPRSPGLIEIIIGAMLVLYVGWRPAVVALGGFNLRESRVVIFPVRIYLAFLYLLIVPTVIGTIRMWDPVDILRDVIPLIYLFIPLFILPVMMTSSWEWEKWLPWLISIIGVALSIRYFITVGETPLGVGVKLLFDDKLYLPYDPAVLFASIFLPLEGLRRMRWRIWPTFRAVLSGLGGLVALASLAGVIQRAPLGLAFLSYCTFVIVQLRYRPGMAAVVLFIMLCVASLFWGTVSGIFDLIIRKQETVGINEKGRELLVVIDAINRNMQTAIFGLGWGAVFNDPAAGGIKVSYVHNMIGYSLLKTGLLGITSILVYLVQILKTLKIKVSSMPLVLACVSSLLVGILFQASYKTFSYGLLLLIPLIQRKIALKI